MIDRRCIRYFDWIGFSLTLGLLIFGLFFVFSATYKPDIPVSLFFKKQLFGALSGLGLYLFFSFKDLRNFTRACFFGYFGLLCLLVYTIIGGFIGMGAKRWISLAFIRFQPSELVKFILPAFLAYYFCEEQEVKYPLLSVGNVLPHKIFMFPLVILGISFLLVAKQPDLGTALIIIFSGLVTLWFVGLDRRFFIVCGILGLCAAPLLWHVLKPYQQKRILVLLGQGDTRKERYQVEQSIIAIGSGGLTGKGFLKGTQNKLEFLPEDHTDMIFAVIAEEIGFLGVLVLLLLFCLLFIRLMYITSCLESFFEQIMAIGFIMPIFISVIINLAMVMGLLPIVGIPLPLVSYGVTNLWITLASLGWLNNIAIRRFYY